MEVVFVNIDSRMVITEKQYNKMVEREIELAREDYLEEYLDDLGIEEIQDKEAFEKSLTLFVLNDLGYTWLSCDMELDD